MRSLLIPVALVVLAGCAPDQADPAPAASPAAVPAAVPAASQAVSEGPAVPSVLGAVPTLRQWSGTWLFQKMALQLVIVERSGALEVSATSTASKDPGKPPVPCVPVVLTGALTCTIHSASTGKDLPIQLRRAGADPSRVDFLTILVGDYPVEVGARQDVEGESESAP